MHNPHGQAGGGSDSTRVLRGPRGKSDFSRASLLQEPLRGGGARTELWRKCGLRHREGERGIPGSRNCTCKLMENRADVASQRVLLRVPWEAPALLCADLTTMPTGQVVFSSTPPIKNCDLGQLLNPSLLWFPHLYLPHKIVIRIE